jgi:hypothetical protein
MRACSFEPTPDPPGPPRSFFNWFNRRSTFPSHLHSFSRRLRESCCIQDFVPSIDLTEEEVVEHVETIRAAAQIVDPVVSEPVVLADPNDDPVLYTAVVARADVLCTRDRHFYAANVMGFCRMRNIRLMDELELLGVLRAHPTV